MTDASAQPDSSSEPVVTDVDTLVAVYLDGVKSGVVTAFGNFSSLSLEDSDALAQEVIGRAFSSSEALEAIRDRVRGRLAGDLSGEATKVVLRGENGSSS